MRRPFEEEREVGLGLLEGGKFAERRGGAGRGEPYRGEPEGPHKGPAVEPDALEAAVRDHIAGTRDDAADDFDALRTEPESERPPLDLGVEIEEKGGPEDKR